MRAAQNNWGCRFAVRQPRFTAVPPSGWRTVANLLSALFVRRSKIKNPIWGYRFAVRQPRLRLYHHRAGAQSQISRSSAFLLLLQTLKLFTRHLAHDQPVSSRFKVLKVSGSKKTFWGCRFADVARQPRLRLCHHRAGAPVATCRAALPALPCPIHRTYRRHLFSLYGEFNSPVGFSSNQNLLSFFLLRFFSMATDFFTYAAGTNLFTCCFLWLRPSFRSRFL